MADNLQEALTFCDMRVILSEQQPRERISFVHYEGSEVRIKGTTLTLVDRYREVGRIDLLEEPAGREG